MSSTPEVFQALAHRLESGALGRQSSRHRVVPSREAMVDLLAGARLLLFPRHHGSQPDGQHPCLEESLTRLHDGIYEQVCRELSFMGKDERTAAARAREIARAWVERLPTLQTMLELDVEAAYEGDPALYSTDEAVLCYPGITAVICFRLAHELRVLGVPLLARMMTEHAHSVTGIDIHPGAQIGESFFVDHGTGVVIGETAVIGNHVRLY
ncbi:MAG: serine O-acetyltransferase, partial [Acidobacteriota bacterium]